MGSIEIRHATQNEMIAFWGEHYGSKAEEAEACFVDGEPVAMVGLAHADGRLWAFFNLTEKAAPLGLRLVRAILRGLHDRNTTVFVQCAGTCTAKKLMGVLGFERTGEARQCLLTGTDLAVWQWRP